MFIQDLDIHSPQSLPELLDLLENYREDAKLLAGGTDLILQYKLKKWAQKHVVNVKEIPGLNQMAYENDHFIIGCNTTLTELLANHEIKQDYRALWDSIHELADVQIRNRGTLAGNICNGSPAADTSPPLLAYQAKVLLKSVQGEREMSLEEFFVGPGKTAIKPNEMMKAVHIPKPPGQTYCSFQKLGRVYDDIALVNAAVQLQFDESLRCISAAIAMGAVGPTTRRAPQAEKILCGERLSDELIERAALQAAEESTPIKDVRASAAYRKKTVGILVERALRDVAQRAKTESM
jgi:CO/xanthine dehydrogenase FAD-binding subunit